MVFYSKRGQLQGIRSGNWKYLELPAGKKSKTSQQKTKRHLFNLVKDIGERNNLAASNAAKADELRLRMLAADEEISANARPVWQKQIAEKTK